MKMIKAKPFSISRRLVYMAYQKVRSNKGSAGVDGITLIEFDKDHRNHLYKLWNQMSSGSYMPPAVKLVEIPKKGGGTRPLGIPTVVDRIAQTVVRGLLEPQLESLFHVNSYGCRKDRSAHDAVAKARERCWKQSWVVDLDIEKFYDTIPHDLLMKAVKRHCNCRWMLLYIERWLAAPVQIQDGTIIGRTMGVPQGSVVGPVLANLYLHYCLDKWLSIEHPHALFERYMDDMLIHCRNENEGQTLMKAIDRRLDECGLRMHPTKTKLVYCKDSNRTYNNGKHMSFDFLGFTFKPRMAQHGQRKETFTNWLPAVSKKSMLTMNEKMRAWKVWEGTKMTLPDIAASINPIVRGWINYYGRFYITKLKEFMRTLDVKLVNWARRKYKRLRVSFYRASTWLSTIKMHSPEMFVHWKLLESKTTVG